MNGKVCGGSKSEGKPYRVAIVGAGPSGLYVADALLEQNVFPVSVDIFDRLPTPYGLIRYGVAPDHPKIKHVAATLGRVFEHLSVRFVGNVNVGADISTAELTASYHAVIYATGASADRRLRIPGENLPGSISAREFVAWYNGHPDASLASVPYAKSAVIVGAGNVALDVGRMLLLPASQLRLTDVPAPVLSSLQDSHIQEVHILARRGPLDVKFTPKELRALERIPGVQPRVVSADVAKIGRSGLSRSVSSNLDTFQRWAQTPPEALDRTIVFHFWRRPVEVVGMDRVQGLIMERTRVEDMGDSVVGTGEFETLQTEFVLRAVGYFGVPPVGLPFDYSTGTVANLTGRVVDRNGQIRPREYVAGWLKRGPFGVIGTNRPDAAETVRSVLDDLSSYPDVELENLPDIMELLRTRKTVVVNHRGWLAIEEAEGSEGKAVGRGRVKIRDWARLRSIGSTATKDEPSIPQE